MVSSSRIKTVVSIVLSLELEKLIAGGNNDGCGWLDLKPQSSSS